ncbi:MAG TPA: DUF3365 domain-containing protein [Longimicrobiales bacterium]|nr:DUF3365 domain-containing protein [Longimicrobiales bacterium]
MRGIGVALAVALLAACGERPGGGADDVATQTATDAITAEKAAAIGESAAGALASALMTRVQTAMQEQGPAYAITFCSEEALPLTEMVEDSLGGGLELKRTSTRIRNPKNAPDELEKEALSHFAAELEAGRPLPPHHLQRTDAGWRYYKPILVAELCTRCHGPREALDPSVQQVLAERYPDDQATGYAPGDFRGVIRVSIPSTRAGDDGR